MRSSARSCGLDRVMYRRESPRFTGGDVGATWRANRATGAIIYPSMMLKPVQREEDRKWEGLS
jgi:hypothetical protein